MCARLLACPLCSQPGFLTLDALRVGLVSVATRPLACPVCNEVLLGIDKLTIHLFGHTVAQGNAVVGGGNESAKMMEVTSVGNGSVQAMVRNAQAIPLQSWNVLNATQANLELTCKRQFEESSRETTTGSIYIPIDEIETFRNLTGLKDDAGNLIPVSAGQNGTVDIKAPSQVILLQNVQTQPKIFSTNLINQINQSCNTENDNVEATTPVEEPIDETGKESYTHTSWSNNIECKTSPSSEYTPSYTDRLADLVKSSQITASPLGNFHESFDCPNPEPPSKIVDKPIIKSTKIVSANERTERCNICGFHFTDRNILVLHKQLAHMPKTKDLNVTTEDLMKNYPCHLCTKVFKMRGSLMVHMRVAHPGVNSTVTLKDCHKTKQDNDTSREQKAFSSNEQEGSYNCPTCGKNFKKEQHVTQHLKIHEAKQWECDVCSKMFTTKYFLKKHKRLHSGEMPYKCNICDKTFTFQQSYHKHRLYHKDDKPHSCSTCGRSFKELSTLHNHERIHTGEKPFACETCGKCFRQRVSYLVHRRIHTGVMPYKCTICGKSFRYKVSQRTHKCQQEPFETNNFIDDLLEESTVKITEELSAQDNQTIDANVANEENQYVFVLNADGQHILKRKLDVENSNNQNSLDKNTAEQNVKDLNQTSEFANKIWNNENTNKMEFQNNYTKRNEIASNDKNNSNVWHEISNTDSNSDNNISNNINMKEINTQFSKNIWSQSIIQTNKATFNKANLKIDSNTKNDFFSMVISPIESEISSPSTEMKHLRLSSPINNQENYALINNNTNVVLMSHNSTAENFNRSNVHLSTLQTINEDSLKELLSGITDK